jgi:hypothetical protein
MPQVAFALGADAPTDLVVDLNGTQFTIASFGVPVPVEPGEHVFVVRSKGRLPKSLRVTLKEGERLTLLVEAGARLFTPERDRRVVAASSRGSSSGFTLGVLSLGLAGSAFAVGGVSGAIVLHDKSITDDPAHCDADGGCDAEGLAAAERGNTLATVSNIAFGVGLAAAGLGAYFLLSSPDEAPKDRSPKPALSFGVRTLAR